MRQTSSPAEGTDIFLAVLALVIVGGGLATPAAAQTAISAARITSLAEASRRGLFQTGVTSGRITVFTMRMRPSPVTAKVDAAGESLLVRAIGAEFVVTYVQPGPQEKITIEIATHSNRINIRREPQAGGTSTPVEFTQPATGLLRLVVGAKDSQREYRAASLWHLFLAQRTVCREELAPLLQRIDPRTDFAKEADEIEEDLVQLARTQDLPDRRRLEALVAQLRDEKYSRREAADRELRASGRMILGYLQRLDRAGLDAEQKFRLRHIVGALTENEGIDTPDRVATWLAGDPTVWLGLLGHDSEPIRLLAARQLAALLDRPLVFDPAAAAATRQLQIDRIRPLLGEPTSNRK